MGKPPKMRQGSSRITEKGTQQKGKRKRLKMRHAVMIRIVTTSQKHHWDRYEIDSSLCFVNIRERSGFWLTSICILVAWSLLFLGGGGFIE